ncbi:hypothetical protein PVAP13_9KG411300 [Panicum virgatum]|uniref:Uncharacterized protein n=1 Tax=Panicum virgatum TaxID=38727 RepID=A0A8T0NQV3_PANVG|nr:hypothetical protein PVAP13_9KG411300 [Panicum virgatum]
MIAKGIVPSGLSCTVALLPHKEVYHHQYTCAIHIQNIKRLKVTILSSRNGWKLYYIAKKQWEGIQIVVVKGLPVSLPDQASIWKVSFACRSFSSMTQHSSSIRTRLSFPEPDKQILCMALCTSLIPKRLHSKVHLVLQFKRIPSDTN